jgi:hypothetical protein
VSGPLLTRRFFTHPNGFQHVHNGPEGPVVVVEVRMAYDGSPEVICVHARMEKPTDCTPVQDIERYVKEGVWIELTAEQAISLVAFAQKNPFPPWQCELTPHGIRMWCGEKPEFKTTIWHEREPVEKGDRPQTTVDAW